MGLRKDSLEKAVEVIRKGGKVEEIGRKTTDPRYLEKILREEAIKQFDDKRRPLLEMNLFFNAFLVQSKKE